MKAAVLFDYGDLRVTEVPVPALDEGEVLVKIDSVAWITGIRVGSLRTGIVDYLIHGTVPRYPNGSNPEGVAVDAAGNVHGAVVSQGGAFVKSSRAKPNAGRAQSSVC